MAGIVGPGAAELIAEACLAITNGLTIKDIALTVHAHPTLSETMMEAAELFYAILRMRIILKQRRIVNDVFFI